MGIILLDPVLQNLTKLEVLPKFCNLSPTAFIQSAVKSSRGGSTHYNVLYDELHDSFANFRHWLNFTFNSKSKLCFKCKPLSLVPSVNSSYAFNTCANV